MLQTSFGEICKSWDVVNIMLKNQVCIIKSSFQKTIKDIDHEYNSPFFQSLNHCVSRKCFKKIDKELQRVKIVGTDKTKYGFSIRTTDGLPCACELEKLLISGNVIPLDIIHVFWRNLSIEHELKDEESLTDYDFLEEVEAMKTYMKKQNIIGQRIFRAKVCELVFPHTTSIIAPPEKEYVDVSQEYAKQPSQHSARQPSQRYANQPTQYSARQPYNIQFPTFIHMYIKEIIYVVLDGNCGFRAIP
ncbi:uncharacterized protein [Cicer arietinum]|uniref:uncharacterized protein n=1 Tax=Cicer arietinum TaxID=3827 RepID=UPI003CC66150